MCSTSGYGKNTRGFTLVELIIVIIILGILSVTAAPRFLDLSTDAKIANVESFAGTLKSSVYLFQMKAKAAGGRVVSTPEGDFDVTGSAAIELAGTPEPKSEATNPNLYFIETFVDLPTLDSETKNNSTRTATQGDVRVFENNQVSRIGYGTGDLTAGNCYAEYRRVSGAADVTSVTSGC